MAFDIEGARADGYSDEDIVNHLVKKNNFDVNGALKDGYTYADIANHLASKPSAKPAPAPVVAAPPDTSSDFLRGLGNLPGQVQETYGAAKALTGVAFGSKSLAQSGLESMKEGEGRQSSKESDSFTKAWDQGLWTVVTDWLPYQAGAGAGTLLETLAFMGIGGVGGGATTGGAGAIPGAVTGVVAKQLIKSGVKEAAEELVKKETKKLIAEGATKEAAKLAAAKAGKEFAEAEAKKVLADITTQAAKQYAKEGGKKVGLGAMATMHGMGEVGSRAFQEAEQQGKAPEDIDLARVIPAAAVHAMADYASERIGLGMLKADGKSLGSLAMDVLKQIAIGGAKETPPELIQTMAERYGAHLSLADAEALKEYGDTVAASFGMMAMPGVVGGTRTNFAGKVEKAIARQKAEQEDLDKTRLAGTSAAGEGYKLAPAEAQVDEELAGKLSAVLDENGNPLVQETADTTQVKQQIKSTKDTINANAEDVVSRFDAGGKDKPNRNEISATLKALGIKIGIEDRTNESKINKIREHLAQQGGPSASGPQQPAAGASATVAAQPATAAGESTKPVDTGVASTQSAAGATDAGKKVQPPTLKTMKPGQQVTLYRGENAENTANGQWWTTDKAKAEKYGKVTSVTLPAEVIGNNAAMGHGGPDEFVFTGKKPSELAAAPTEVVKEEAKPTVTPDIQVRRETIATMVKKGQTGGDAFKRSLAKLNQLEKAAGLPLTTAGGTLKAEEDTLAAAMRMMSKQEQQEQEDFENAVDEATNWRNKEKGKEGQADWQYDISKEDRDLYDETRKEVNEERDAHKQERERLVAEEKAAKERLKEVQRQMDELAEDAPENEIHKFDLLEQDAVEAVHAAQRAVEAHGPTAHALPEWDKLSPHMKDVYFGHITSGPRDEKGNLTFGSSRREHRKAAKALQKHRAEIGGREKETRSPEEERIVLHYEEERHEASKREGVNFPPWNKLTKEQRDVYLQEVVNNAGILQRLSFTALAKKLVNDSKELTQEQKNILLANIAFREEQQREFAENAKKLKDLQEQNRKKVEGKGTTRLPDEVIKMVRGNNLQGVLQYLRSRPTDKYSPTYRRIANAIANSLFGMKLNTKIEMAPSLPKGALAMYDPYTDTIYVTEAGLSESTILHEVVHAGTVKIINIYLNGNKKLLTPEQIAACEQLETIMKETRSELIERYPNAYKNLFEFVSYSLTNSAMQEDLHDLSAEFHETGKAANTLFNLFERRFGPPSKQFSENIETILPKEKSQWSKFKLAVADILKVTKSYLRGQKLQRTVDVNFPMEVMAAFDDILAVPEGGIVLPEGEKLEAAGQKAPPTPRKMHDVERNRDDPSHHITSKEMPHPLIETLKKLNTREGWIEAARLFSDNRVYIRNWERMRDQAGMIYREGKDKINNIYSQIIRSAGEARNFYNVYLSEAADALDSAISDFAHASKYPAKRALEELHKILEVIHEPERRVVKYLLNVPLDFKNAVLTFNGKKISAAELRAEVVKLLDTKTLSEAQAKFLRAQLDRVVFEHDANGQLVLDQYGYPKPNMKFVDAYGHSPDTKTTDKKGNPIKPGQQIIDITDEKYNATGIDIASAKKLRDGLATDPQRKEIEAVIAAIKKLHEGTTKLNKIANYWSIPVSNRVAFYGWENYVPLKGRTLTNGKADPRDDALKFDEIANRFGAHGRELQEHEEAFGGRFTPSDNPILQTMTDGSRAALRAGRRNVTLATKNAILSGMLKGTIKNIKFEERNNVDVKDLGGKRAIFHYNEDGSIDILKVQENKLRDAISRTYKDTNVFVNTLNKWTSRLGQTHTRYNYQFGVKNFVVDTLTNAWNISASELGPLGGAAYIADVAQNVMTGGLYKAGQVATLFQKGDEKSIRALQGMMKNDPYVRDMVEYIQHGSMVSHLNGMSLQSNFEELNKQVGRSGVLRSVDQLNQFLDIWGNMFELASRASAYSVAKNRFINNQKMSEESAKDKARAFAKGLANFEQVGELGREMGAWYMFFRPSAVSAHRAIEALAPAFTSKEQAESRLPPDFTAEQKATYMKNFALLQRNARISLAASIGLGMVAYTMAMMLSDDDDDLGRNPVATDNMDLWTRYARFHIPRKWTEAMGIAEPVVFQIPWGFGIGSLSAIGPQLLSVGFGTNKLSSAAANIFTSVALDSFLPIPVSRISPLDSPLAFTIDTIMPSPIRPLVELLMNKNGLGQDITSSSQRRLGAAYVAGDNIPEMWKDVAEWLHDSTDGLLNFSANEMYFLSNSYIDGISRIAETGYNMADMGQGRRDFSPKQDMMLFGSFFGVRASYDAREFASVEKQIKAKEKVLNDYKLKPALYSDYISRHPFDEALVDLYNKSVNTDLNPLRAQDNVIRNNKNMSPSQKRELLRVSAVQEALIKRNMIDMFKAYDIKP